MDTALLIIALLVMLVGLVGVILPLVPGIPLIFGAALIYTLLTDFETVGLATIIIFALLTAFTYLLDWLAATYGVKRMGGTYLGMIGAFTGMIVGLFIGGLVGLVIGAFLGAFILELAGGKESPIALKAGMGSFLGLLAGGVVKFIIGAVMIGVFLWQVVIK